MPRKSWSPDVTMIIFIPVAVAIESKRAVATAKKELRQAIEYADSGRYDASSLRSRACLSRIGNISENSRGTFARSG